MKVWVYIDNRQQGPFEMEELRRIEGFNENTKVWFEGLPKWYPAGSLNELRPLFETIEADAEPEPHDETPCESVEETIEERAAENPFAPGRMYIRRVQLEEPCPPTHLGWSIFLLICCCSPLSAAALVASICTSSFYSQGNLAKARKSSEITEWLIMLSFALGILPMLFMAACM